MSAKQKKITVLLDEKEFQKFDDFCREHGFKKSTLLVRLLKQFICQGESAAPNQPLGSNVNWVKDDKNNK